MLRLLLSTAMAALFLVPARGADVAIGDVSVGFDGAYKAGQWAPLVVRFEGDAALSEVLIETETSDAAGSQLVRSSGPVPVVREGETTWAAATFQTGRLGSDVVVRLKSTDGTLLAEKRLRDGSEELPPALARGTSLWVTTFPTTSSAGSTPQQALPVPPGVTMAAIGTSLPAERLSWSAADLLIIRGDLNPTADETNAIRDWVASGGHLAISVGRFTDEFRGGPLAEWVPIKVDSTVQLRDLSPIEIYSGSDRRLPARARVRAARLNDAAQVLLETSDTPLIARSPYGFGQVTLFAIDLDDFPFSTWAGLPGLVQRSLHVEESDGDRSRRRSVTGVTDLGTQLLRSEETFSGVTRPSVGMALVLLLLYALVVGPLDYFIVHRLLRRPALTWITLPLIVLGAGWWLHRTAIAAHGAKSLVNELHIEDFDAASGTFRGRSSLTLFAANPARVSIDARPAHGTAEGNHKTHLAWTAPPEESFGGIYRDSAGGLFHPQYEILPSQPGVGVQAANVPLLVGASRGFTAEWQRSELTGLVDSQLTSRSRGRIEGTINHHFAAPITDYIVVFGGRIFIPREREWHPDEPISPGTAAFEPGDLDSYLKRRIASKVEKKKGEGGADYIVTETAYDPLGTDLDVLMRMLTFHQAAGGKSYTGLSNEPLSRSDLTSLMQLGRAIVVGRIDVPPATVKVTAEEDATFETERRTTFVRLVLPVEKVDVAPLKTLPPADPREVERERERQRAAAPEFN